MKACRLGRRENGTGIVQDELQRLYIVELGVGVHVYNNSNPRDPVAITFITIPGVTSVTVSRNRMFANNFGDLVTIDITDLNNVRVVDRDAGLYPQPLDYPLGHFGFFECFDANRGLLIGWGRCQLKLSPMPHLTLNLLLLTHQPALAL